MNIKTIRRILALQSTVVLLAVVPFLATGAESDSFQLYTNFDEADQTPLTSNNYSLDEGGGTWTAVPLAGSNFQIVTAPPVSSSSSSTSSSSSSEGTGDGGTGGTDGGGGRRPRPSSSSSYATTSSTEQSQPQSTSSSQSSVPKDKQLDANVVPGTVEDITRPSAGQEPTNPEYELTEGTDPETGRACLCKCPKAEEVHCAAGTFEERLVRIPVLIPVAFQSPLPSMLLLIIAFILGYLTRSTRSGEMQISSSQKQNKPNQKK